MIDTALTFVRVCLLSVGALLLGATTVEVPPLITDLKAAYLYKLPQFVTWPKGAITDNNFVICVFESGAFRDVVADAARGQTVLGLPIRVHRVSAAEDARACAVIYFPPGDALVTLARLRGAPVLTVTDGEPAGQRGVVNLALEAGHLRFDIDLGIAAADRLTISSKLLDIAAQVTGRPSR